MKFARALQLIGVLIAGTLLLALTTYQTVIPVAAWLAPVLLLRFTRNVRSHWLAIPGIVAAAVVGHALAIRDPSLQERSVWIMAAMYGIGMSLAYIFDRFFARHLLKAPISRSLLFPCAMVIVEFIAQLANPYGNALSQAYSQSVELSFLQLAAITGTSGVTFLLAWGASVMNAIWEHEPPGAERRAVLAFAIIAGGVLLLGGARVALDPPVDKSVRVAAIPADQRLYAEASEGLDVMRVATTDNERAAARARFTANLEELFRRTEQAAREGAKVIVWSEAAALFLEEDSPPIFDRAIELAKKYNVYLLMSSGIIPRTDTYPFYQIRAMVFDPTGTKEWEYDKSYPLPGLERSLVVPGTRELPMFDTEYGKIATLLSTDGDFARYVAQAGRNRAIMLLVPSNESPAHRASHPYMHLFRAVENGFSIIRPTSNGISLVADPMGRILASSDSITTPRKLILVDVPLKRAWVAFPWTVDAFVWCIVLLTVGLIVRAYRERSALMLWHLNEELSTKPA